MRYSPTIQEKAAAQESMRDRIERNLGHLAGAITVSDRPTGTSVSYAEQKARRDKVIRLILPWGPTVNHQYGRKGSQTYLKPPVIAFRREVVVAVRAAKIARSEALLRVSVKLLPPDRRKRDIDGPIKALLDALQHAGAYADDSQIVELHIFKLEPVKGGQIEVEIRNA